MAETLLSILERLNKRIKELAADNEELKADNIRLQEDNKELQRKATEAETLRTRAELDAEYLAVSYKLADNPDTLAETRRRIAGLIRNIDRCLEMLKE